MKLSFNKKEKWALIFFCLFFFWTSNTVEIYGGSCDSSPCGGVNHSDAADNGEWITDYSGATGSNLLLAPINLLTPQALNLIGDYEIVPSDDYKISRIYTFDQAEETIEVGPELAISDTKPLLTGFFGIKLLTLLNLPLWILLGILLVKLQRYSRVLGGIVASVLILGLIGIKLFMWVGMPNYSDSIWNMIGVYFS